MSQPQEIIVYRNPMEYSLYNSDLLFPIMVSAVVCIAVVYLVAVVQSYFLGKRRYIDNTARNPFHRMVKDIYHHVSYCLSLYVGAGAAIFTFWKMTHV